MPGSTRPATLTPRALGRARLIEAVALSPDGELVVYAERAASAAADRTSLWMVPFRGGRPRRLTHGAWTDGRPRFSPDGRTLVFTSTREGDVAQVWLLPLDGGEPRRVTSFRRGVSEVEWMPDGRNLAVAAYDDESPVLIGERRKGQATARVLRRIDWRLDGSGLLDHPTHVHLVTLSGRSRRLTRGDWSASHVRPHPDGRSIAFLSDRNGTRDLRAHPQVHKVGVGGGRIRRLSALGGEVLGFSFDPDGTLIVVALARNPARSYEPWIVWRVARDGSGTPLTAHIDRFFGQGETDDQRFSVVHDDGRDIPTRVDDDDVRPLVDASLDPTALALASAGQRVAAVMTLGTVSHPDLYAIAPGHPPRRLTRVGDAWLRPYRRPEMEELEIDGPAGPIQTFVLSPPGAGRRPTATILQIHGGPTWAWSASPPADSLLWASAGYRVVRPNIRGSFNRGAAWIEALEGNWGVVDAEDCHAVLDHLVEHHLADPARLGCYGNSYGGFMVNWLVGTSDRFAAAVCSNGVVNQVSAFAHCDVGAQYSESEGLGTPVTPEGVDLMWRQSPLRHVANVHTPLLILQGEADLRCPPSDNEQMFVALRWLQRDVEYVLYPESDHEMSFSSRPDRRVDRAERILAWFRRYMRP